MDSTFNKVTIGVTNVPSDNNVPKVTFMVKYVFKLSNMVPKMFPDGKMAPHVRNVLLRACM